MHKREEEETKDIKERVVAGSSKRRIVESSS
jgi:hypothetical protein